jgi:ParB/RepB/Spo0J family partition protein
LKIVDRKKLHARIFGDTKLTGAIRDQVNQDYHAAEGDLRVIPLDRIDPNPNNPRRLLITRGEVSELHRRAADKAGLSSSEEKPNEIFFSRLAELIQEVDNADRRDHLEKICLLAKSINKRGLIQPISVYSGNDRRYTVMAGERRYLAHAIIGRPTIRALVRERQGDELQDRVGSLVENIVREDLSTAERVDYIEELVKFHGNLHPGQPMTAEQLHELIHESVRTCKRYLRFIQAPKRVREAIRAGELSTVREIEEELKTIDRIKFPEPPPTSPEKTKNDAAKPEKVPRRGRERKDVVLGKTRNVSAIRALMTAWLGKTTMAEKYGNVNWQDLDEVQEAWTKFLETLVEQTEQVEAVNG